MQTKSYVDIRLNDLSITRNNTHVGFSDKNFDNVSFVRVNSMREVRENLTLKHYVDQAIFYNVDELSLLRLDPDEKLKLDEQDSIVLNSNSTTPKTIIKIPSKSYNDSLHEINRNRRGLSTVYNDQDNEYVKNKLSNLYSTTVNRDPSSDIELANKKYVDASIGEGNVLRFNQTLENYLKVSIDNDVYNLTKYDLK